VTEPMELTHDLADEVLRAVRDGKLNPDELTAVFVAHEIGPAVELAITLASDPIDGLGNKNFSAAPSLTNFWRSLSSNKPIWVDEVAGRSGFYRTRKSPSTRDENLHTFFSFNAQLAAEASGFARRTAKALVGAMGEIEDNIYEHSGAYKTGIIAFQSARGAFTFVVADAGMGVLDSLRQSQEFAELKDHGLALELALQDGVSRLSDVEPHRGQGFHSLFVGLASLKGHLRFASGDHALIMRSNRLIRSEAHLIQKTLGRGFVVSITCRP
jgi:hypothetical protein